MPMVFTMGMTGDPAETPPTLRSAQMKSPTATTANLDLTQGVTPPTGNEGVSLTPDEIKNILDRLQMIDFETLELRDATLHVRVMRALLTRITREHEKLVKLRDEVATRTRDARMATETCELASALSELHRDLKPAKKRSWAFWKRS